MSNSMLDKLSQLGQQAQQAQSKSDDRIAKAKGSSDDLFKNLKSWSHSFNEKDEPMTSKFKIRLLPQGKADTDIIEAGKLNVGDDLEDYRGMSVLDISAYQLYEQDKGWFRFMSPSNWGVKDEIEAFKWREWNRVKKEMMETRGLNETQAKELASQAVRSYNSQNKRFVNGVLLAYNNKPEMVGKVVTWEIKQVKLWNHLRVTAPADTDALGDVKAPVNLYDMVSTPSAGVPGGAYVDISLAGVMKKWNNKMYPQAVFESSKMGFGPNRPIIEDWKEFLLPNGSNPTDQEAEDWLLETWASAPALLPYLDMDKYFVDPAELLNKFMDFHKLDEEGKTRPAQSAPFNKPNMAGGASETDAPTNKPVDETANTSEKVDMAEPAKEEEAPALDPIAQALIDAKNASANASEQEASVEESAPAKEEPAKDEGGDKPLSPIEQALANAKKLSAES